MLVAVLPDGSWNTFMSEINFNFNLELDERN